MSQGIEEMKSQKALERRKTIDSSVALYENTCGGKKKI